MKKAKEYAKEIIETYIEKDTNAALKKAAEANKCLFGEYEEIVKIRKISQYPAMLSLLKEQHLKWVSICRHVNKEVELLNEKGFLNVIEDKMTMIYPNLLQIL